MSLQHPITFYAQAAYLEANGQSQELPPSPGIIHRPGVDPASSLDKQFLDTIALLSAYYKPSAAESWHSTTALHVTAAALKRTKQEITVYIAKNGGPQWNGQKDGNNDRNFGHYLQAWLNHDAKVDPLYDIRIVPRMGADEELEESFENEMSWWWRRRLVYYEDQFRIYWKPEEFSEVKMFYKTHYQQEIDVDVFERDWRSVENLVAQSKQMTSFIVDQLLASGGTYLDIGEQAYPRTTISPAAARFRKAIKSVALLQTVRRALNTFKKFRSTLNGRKVTFEYLPRRSLSALPKDEIVSKLEQLKGYKQNKFIKKNFQRAICGLTDTSSTPKFHCELQLLAKLYSENDVLDYFGCSKLSCFFCWHILRETPFTTRSTHHKIYYQCGFQFEGNPDLEQALQITIDKLKSCFNSLLKYQRHESIHWQDNDFMSETVALSTTRSRLVLENDQMYDSILGSSEFQYIQGFRIPQIGEPEMYNFKAFDLQAAGTLRYEFNCLFWPDDIFRSWWVSEMQLEQKSVAPWAVLDVPGWHPRQGAPEDGLVLLCRVQDDSGSILPANEWCQRTVRDYHSRRGPGKTKSPMPWKGDLFFFFQRSRYEQKANLNSELGRVVEAFTADYLHRLDSFGDKVYEYMGQVVMRASSSHKNLPWDFLYPDEE